MDCTINILICWTIAKPKINENWHISLEASPTRNMERVTKTFGTEQKINLSKNDIEYLKQRDLRSKYSSGISVLCPEQFRLNPNLIIRDKLLKDDEKIGINPADLVSSFRDKERIIQSSGQKFQVKDVFEEFEFLSSGQRYRGV